MKAWTRTARIVSAIGVVIFAQYASGWNYQNYFCTHNDVIFSIVTSDNEESALESCRGGHVHNSVAKAHHDQGGVSVNGGWVDMDDPSCLIGRLPASL